MAFTTIDDPSAHFKVQLYTGDGTGSGSGGQAITFNDTDTDMQPDLIWVKDRGAANSPVISDSVRGTDGTSYYQIKPSATSTQTTNAEFLLSIQSDGFTVGSNGKWGANTNTYVAWCWKANGSGSANSEGNTTTTATSANTTAGFSIITYEGDGAAATLGHGLGAVPHLIIQKNIDDTENWQVYHHRLTSAPETDYLTLNTTNATGDQSSRWNDTAPTSTLISIGSDSSVSQSGESMVMYAWSEKQGFSKFGTYEGTSDANGPMIYTGFKPAFVLGKKFFGTTGGSGGGDNWELHDNKRNTFNPVDKRLYPNVADAEDTRTNMDFLSNGFKIRTGSGEWNENDNFYIYMAFAEAPFVNSNGVPCNAR